MATYFEAEAAARGSLHGALSAAQALLRHRRAPAKAGDPQLAKAVMQRDGALDDVTRLRLQVDRLQESLSSLERNRDADIAAITHSIEAAAKKESATQVKEMKMAIDVLNSEVAARDSKISDLRKQLLQRSKEESGDRRALQEKIDSLTADLLRRDAMLDERSKIFYSLNKELEKDEKLQQTAVEEYLRAQAAHDRIAEARDALSRELSLRDAELEEARSKISHLSSELIESSLRQESTLEACYATHRRHVDSLMSEFSEAKSELQNSIAELLQQNSEQLTRNEQLQDQLDDAKASHEELMEQLENVCTMSDAMKHQLAAVELAKMRGDEENAELGSLVTRLTHSIDDLQRERLREVESRDAELAKRHTAIDAARSLFLSSSRKVSEAAMMRRAIVQWMRFQSRAATDRLREQDRTRQNENAAIAAKLSSLREEHRLADEEIGRLSEILSTQVAANNESLIAMEKMRHDHQRFESEQGQQLAANIDLVRTLTRRVTELEALVDEKLHELEDAKASLASSRHAQDQLSAALADAARLASEEVMPSRRSPTGVRDEVLPVPAPARAATVLTITHDVGSQSVPLLHIHTASQTLEPIRPAAAGSTQTHVASFIDTAIQTEVKRDEEVVPTKTGLAREEDLKGTCSTDERIVWLEKDVSRLQGVVSGLQSEAQVAAEKLRASHLEKSEAESRNRQLVNDVWQAKDAFAGAMAELEAVRTAVGEVETSLANISSTPAGHQSAGRSSLGHRLDSVRRQIEGLRPGPEEQDATATCIIREVAVPFVIANQGLREVRRVSPEKAKSPLEVEEARSNSKPKPQPVVVVDAQTWPATACISLSEHELVLHDVRLQERERFLQQFMNAADSFAASRGSALHLASDESRDSVMLIVHASLQRAYEQGFAKRPEPAKHTIATQATSSSDPHPQHVELSIISLPAATASKPIEPPPAPAASTHNTGYAQLDNYLDALVRKHREELAAAHSETRHWKDRCDALEMQVTSRRDGRSGVFELLSLALESRLLVKLASRAWCHWRLLAEHNRKEKIRLAASKTINSLVANQLKLKEIASAAMLQNKLLEEQLASTRTPAAPASPQQAQPPTPRKTDKMTQAVDDAAIVEARQRVALLSAAADEAAARISGLTKSLVASQQAEKELALGNSELLTTNKRLHGELVAMRLELRERFSAQSAMEADNCNAAAAQNHTSEPSASSTSD